MFNRRMDIGAAFTALFGEGDRQQGRRDDEEDPLTDEDADEAVPSGTSEVALDGILQMDANDIQELSEMRLDISEIQEAIKNHNLWVQDAVATRNDIEDLQGALQEHEDWMSNISGVIKSIEARDVALQKEITSRRTELNLSKPATPSSATSASPRRGATTSSSPRRRASPVLNLALLEEPSPMDAEGLVYPCSLLARERLSAPSSESTGDTSSVGETRHLASTLEAYVARQIHCERQERLSSLAELRGEFAEYRTAYGPGRPLNGGCPAAMPAGAASAAPGEDGGTELSSLRSAVQGLELRMRDKMFELRAELQTLRTEIALELPSFQGRGGGPGKVSGAPASRGRSGLQGLPQRLPVFPPRGRAPIAARATVGEPAPCTVFRHISSDGQERKAGQCKIEAQEVQDAECSRDTTSCRRTASWPNGHVGSFRLQTKPRQLALGSVHA